LIEGIPLEELVVSLLFRFAMSMFRRPGEDSSSSTSSSSEESYEQTEDNETKPLHEDSVLSRIQTLESAASAQSDNRQAPPRLQFRQNSTQDVRDLILHALLEEKVIREAAQRLGKDVSDPEVQRVGKEAYRELARQISNNVDDTYAGEDKQTHRATAKEGISKLTRSNLSRLAAVPEGAALSQALVARPLNGLSLELPQQPPVGFDILSGITVPVELQLRGFPDLQTDRYVREFSELEIVGKGGYGKVFKAKHKLDGSFYAVKRIPVSPAKLAKIQEHGSQELESMLQEVRSLARFDHANVVRYHNAWLEFTTTPVDESVLPTNNPVRPDRLLHNIAERSASQATTEDVLARFDELSFGDVFERPDDSYGGGVVFETSEHDVGADTSRHETDSQPLKIQLGKTSRRKIRRDSQASQTTIATVSSSKSRMSAVEDVNEDDEDVEIIPRSHIPYTQEPASELSENMVTDSDIPGQLVPIRNAGPTLTLNVQMSLCETNLAAFLSADRLFPGAVPVNPHCFHPCVSLELLGSIISGVEYLHAQGLVHRDLKPANVFLSLSTARHAPYGSVDISSCKHCPERNTLHITPRIGDFGLVAALDDSCLDIAITGKPVGTEFYRPETGSRASEKLDVFALGVMGFEMLQEFSTRMERVTTLTDLRRGIFPDSFSNNLGDMGNEVQQLISNMLHTDEQTRLSCEEVKLEMGKLIHNLKA
jgi:translation initiation factor 2-alpha kinase 3